VFVNHGWTSLQFYKPVSMEKTYRSYVKMGRSDKEDGMYDGDMIVFEGDELVAAFKGVRAQGVPRRLMDYIVSMRDDRKTGQQKAPAKQESGHTQERQDSTTRDTTVAEDSSGSGSWKEALQIISEESGVSIPELAPDTLFADLGVDSLLALLCASRFREELGLDYESTIFLDCPSVKDLETFWNNGSAADGTATVTGGDAVLKSMFHDDDTDDTASFELVSDVSKAPTPKTVATSFLLQGNPAAPGTIKTLFLLPDGSGSSSSYASLPRVNPAIAIVGMNSPYMKIPEQYNTGIEDVAAMYIREIRRRQPSGPYAFGGWSVGGIFAYHVAQQLVSEGETVSELLLIDCPVPRGLDHLPKRYYEYCDQIGLLGEVNGVRKAPPQWLIPHFEACVNSLHTYHAKPFVPADAAPETHIIWASDAIDKHVSHKFERRLGDTEGLKFLTESRTDFGPCGWESLLPEGGIHITRAVDANHFSMMHGEHARRLSEFIDTALVPV
jgi:thioesterase domain-containing protein/acyl carrier protein